jgi:hypothetical protein
MLQLAEIAEHQDDGGSEGFAAVVEDAFRD